MRKDVKISGKVIPMEANGGTLREYRKYFQRDFLSDLFKLQKQIKEDALESIEAFECIAWTLAHKANPDIPPIDEWLEQFDGMLDVVYAMQEISNLLSVSSQTIVKPKKNNNHRSRKSKRRMR